jgi:hypothetical protein
MKPWLVLLAFVPAGCSGGAAGTTSAGTSPPPSPAGTTHGDSDAAPPADVTSLVGEVHIHQFPRGSHAWATFLDAPVPLSAQKGDSITELDTAPTKIDGPCVLYQTPVCSPNCTGATYCSAADTCSPLSPPTYVDGGEVDVTGSQLVPTVRLWAEGAQASYRSDPAPGAVQLFAGGELLAFADTTASFAFTGQLPAPVAVAVTQPDMTQPLHLPASGPLPLAWVTEHTDEMVVRVYASSTATGQSAYIRCDTSDTGALTVAADLVAGLPAPPRSTRLEIERTEVRIFSTDRPGIGVLTHAAQTSWENGQD